VSVLQGQGDLAGDLRGAELRHRDFAIDLFLERSPGNVGHGEERLAVDLPRVENGADVGMVQGCRRPGLADEPLRPQDGLKEWPTYLRAFSIFFWRGK
jgi:hypothetical protein